MKAINRKSILPIMSLLLLAFSIALYVYLYMSFGKLKQEVQSLYEEAASSKATHDELSKVRENLKATLGTEERLTSLFVKEDFVVDFIQVIENAMRTAGVSGAVESVNEGSDSDLEDAGKKKLHLVISIQGGFNQIAKFQGLIENLPYKTIIDSATLNYRESDEGSVWRQTVNMTAYMTIGDKAVKRDAKEEQ